MHVHQPVIHIGLHKTGTSWLQDTIFTPRKYRLAHWSDDLCASGKFIEVWKTDRADFNPRQLREYYESRRRVGDGDGLVPVISIERFSGNPHFGGYDRYEIAERLAAIFPDARIVIGIREQKSMIRSCYNQFIKAGGLMTFADYVAEKPEVTRGPTFSLNHFRYDLMIELYQSLFGKERVLVLPYEALRSDPVSYLNRLLRFCNLEPVAGLSDAEKRAVNKAPGCASLDMRRRLNILIRKDILNGFSPVASASGKGLATSLADFCDTRLFAGRARKLARQWEEIVQARVQGVYGRSNAVTQRLTGLDLASMGYDVDATAETSLIPEWQRTVSPATLSERERVCAPSG